MNEKFGKMVTKRPAVTVLLILVISFLMIMINASPSLFGLEKKDKESENSFLPDNEVVEASDKISEEYGVQIEYLQIIVEGKNGNLLTKAGLIDILTVEQQIAENEKVKVVLFPHAGNISSISQVVARAYLGNDQANYSEMLDALKSDNFTDDVVARILGNEQLAPMVARFLTKDYVKVLNETGDVKAKGSMILVMLNATIYDDIEEEQDEDKNPILNADEEIIKIIENTQFTGVKRMGLIEGEYIGQEMQEESAGVMTTLLQIAFLLIVVILVLTYRSFFDTMISLISLVFAIIWMGGIGIILGLSFTGMYDAVPIIIIGLGIDYAIHLILRYREGRRQEGKSVSGALVITIGTVGASIFLATLTTGISFASNGVSEIQPMREFGIFALVGIFSAYIIMVTFIPASKMLFHLHVEPKIQKIMKRFIPGSSQNSEGGSKNDPVVGIENSVTKEPDSPEIKRSISPEDEITGSLQIDEDLSNEEKISRKIGTDARLSRFLAKGAIAAEHHTYPVIAVVALITLLCTSLAVQLDTEWAFTDFLPENAQISEDIFYLTDNFDFGTEEVAILIEGKIDDPDVLRAMNTTENRILDDPDVNEQDPINSILVIMRNVAYGNDDTARNDTFATMYEERDEDGDAVPDRDIADLYFVLLGNESMALQVISVLHFDEESGNFDGAVIRVGVNSNVGARVAEIYEDINDDIKPLENLEGKKNGEGDVIVEQVTATGGPILSHVIINSIEVSGIQSLILTVVVAGVILTIVFYVKDHSLFLGVITEIPVVLVIAWVFASMYLMGMSLNVMTIMISSLTIGIGVDYAIHITHRFVEDLKEMDSIDDACRSTVINTGTALFGAAMTTIGGFGILYFAPMPPLQMFGSIAALSIFFSFVSSVFILPTFLNLWAREVKKRNPGYFKHHKDVAHLFVEKGSLNATTETKEKPATGSVDEDHTHKKQTETNPDNQTPVEKKKDDDEITDEKPSGNIEPVPDPEMNSHSETQDREK